MITAWVIASSLVFLFFGIITIQRAANGFEFFFSVFMVSMCICGFSIAGVI